MHLLDYNMDFVRRLGKKLASLQVNRYILAFSYINPLYFKNNFENFKNAGTWQLVHDSLKWRPIQVKKVWVLALSYLHNSSDLSLSETD